MRSAARGLPRVLTRVLVWGARVLLLSLVCLSLWARIPAAFGCQSVVIDGGSMHPALDPGDIAIACPARGDGLRRGVIAVVDDPGRPGELLTHRVVAVTDRTVDLKGDANLQRDHQSVPRRTVRGVVRFVVPVVGLPGHWVAHGEWLHVAVAAIAVVALVVIATPELVAVLVLPPGMRARRRRARARSRAAHAGAGAPP